MAQAGATPRPREWQRQGAIPLSARLKDDARERGCGTLVELLQYRAAHDAERIACRFLTSTGEEDGVLTYDALFRRAQAFAYTLALHASPGDRVLVLLPAGLDYVTALFACQLAGVICVPAYPPNPRRPDGRVVSIAVDCGARVAIVSSALHHRLAPFIASSPTLTQVEWLSVEQLEANGSAGEERRTSPDTLAFLQYTSGSTGTPRGVMLPHSAIMHNLGVIHRAMKPMAGDEGVFWVPPYHDMGLVGAILQPIYAGFPTTLIASSTFSQRPVRWLEAMTRYGGTTSAAPNFAYDACVDRISDEEKRSLDLSRWRIAFNGAEPVRPDTLARFAAAFAECGFRERAFLPCYGLAEATLFVSGLSREQAPSTLLADRGLLEARLLGITESDHGAPLAAVGPVASELDVRIVDPVRGVACESDEVGEIWIAGPSVARGYWGREDDTAETFGATLPDSPARYLRTGDFGVLHDGELVVTGRLKDLVIVGGRNFYPQDIERAAEVSHPHVRTGAVVAFSTGPIGRERVIIVAEVARHHKLAESPDVVGKIRSSVANTLGLRIEDVVLIRQGLLPKTSSGKLQRRLTRSRYESGELALARPGTLERSAGDQRDASSNDRANELRGWLREFARERLDSRGMDETRTLDPVVTRELALHGLFGLQAPASLGGLALDHVDTLRVIEQLAAIDMTLATYVGGHNSLGVRPILRHASPGLRDRLVPMLARGEQIAALALTEPAAGSNPWAMESLAVPHDDGWQLHGTKSWIGSAGVAGVFNVFARVPGDDGGITAFVISGSAHGLRVGDPALTMGMRAMLQNAVHLEGASAARDAVLGHVGGGIEVAHDTFLHARFGVAAMCLGGIKRAMQLSTRYASRRKVASGRLGDHPATRARLAGMAASAAALDAFLQTIAQTLDSGAPLPEDAFIICKTSAPELLWDAVDGCMQLLGGRGYIEANPAAQLLRDARLLRIFEGPTEPLLIHLGARALREADTQRAFLGETLNAPDLAHRLGEAMERATERLTRQARSGSRAQAHQWSSYVIGAAVTQGAMLASARIALARGLPGADLAVREFEQRFEQALARCRAADATEKAAFAGESVDAALAWANGAIGDVEQRTNRSLDPMLHPEWAEPAKRLARQATPAAVRSVAPLSRTLEFIRTWLADEFQIPADIAAPETSFRDHGLDSLAATRLVVALETRLGRRVDASLLWRSATIGEFAAAVDGIVAEEPLDTPATPHRSTPADGVALAQWPEYRALQARLAETFDGELGNPYFAVHEGISSATARIGNRELLNFSSYNYLGLSGHDEVIRAAQEAAATYGTSVSASRIASGERPVHRELESELARFVGADDALVFVGGHATNVSVLSHLFGPSDIVLCDALIHNSALQGAAFSGARWLTFPHNDWAGCDQMLAELRGRYRRAVIVIEGAYSADGDVPELRRFVEVKARHGAMLMVDEAHSLGVLGATGRGIAESEGVPAAAIDILMGTLSKSLASCGGFIAGSHELVNYLKYTTPGFVYSVGITPSNAAAALAALRVLEREPSRVTKVRDNAALFARLARESGLNVGDDPRAAVVPVIVADSLRAVRASQRLFDCGVNVQPMISPAVANDAARLRFFLSSDHTSDQIAEAVRLTADAIAADGGVERDSLALR